MEYTYKECLDQIKIIFGTNETIDSILILDQNLLKCCVIFGIIEHVPCPIMFKLA